MSVVEALSESGFDGGVSAGEDVDVVIFGAGPAGSVAAGTLARAGRRVICLERGYFPRHTIGESLLPRANELLARAGLWDDVVRRGYIEKRGALFVRGDRRERFCFADGLPGEPPFTFQVPRDDFDRTLAIGARRLGADVRFGHEVSEVTLDERGAEVVAISEETGARVAIRARFVLDCSGPGRVLPRLLGGAREPGLATRAALFTMVEGDLRPEGELAGDIWVCIAEDAWLWIIPFSDGRTSVGAVGDPARFDALVGTDREKLHALVASAPGAAARLAKAVPVLRTMSLRAWSSAVTKLHGPGWAIAGNAGEFLDPVFSSGVTLALETGTLAAELADRTLAGETIDWDAHYEDPIRHAVAVFRAFVEGWYRGDVETIFFAPQRVTSVFRYITSILAGHVRNEKNPLVRDAEGNIRRLARVIARGGNDWSAG